MLGIRFAKALSLRTVAIDNRETGLRLASDAVLKPDLIVDSSDETAAAKDILAFTDGIGLSAVIVCTDSAKAASWSLRRLQPRGVAVVLGLPEEGYQFDAFDLVFKELVVRGSLHFSRDGVEEMLEVVTKHRILSHLTLVDLAEGERIPERVAAHDFEGRLVVKV